MSLRNGEVSHWWQQVGIPQLPNPLGEDRSVDVVIVGGGFTGLWTAYYLAKADPSLRIAVLEQRHVGYGASGRNGGWLTNSITGGRAQYAARYSRELAEDFQLEMNRTVQEVIARCAVEGIDADILPGGEYEVAYTPAQERRLREHVATERTWKHTDLQLLDAVEAKNTIDVAGTRAATWHRHAARIHPAKLVAGLARVVRSLGVEIHENARATALAPGLVQTKHAKVRAQYVVRATEGFTAELPGLRRLWLPMNSSLIVTEPLGADFFDRVGWRRGEVLGDYAHVYMYAQRTADGRIAIGGRGVPYRFGSRTDLDGQTPQRTIEHLRTVMHRMFPGTAGVDIEHAWSGVLGVPRDWTATVGLDRRTGMAWAGGYVGTGVSTTNLAGRTLRDLILGRESELTRLPWVNHRVRRWEPEPLRWLATRSLYAAYSWADRSELAGRATTSPVAIAASRIAGRP
ncbi:FAD-dependent oxidoreductase [Glutamicibacter endophyticus]